MKKISIVIPTYNEEENVKPLAEAIKHEIESKLSKYDYELIFIDNDSKDNTRRFIRGMAEKDFRIKAIFNTRNFGQFNSPYYGLLQSTGDCTILICADFQDPIEMISRFVYEWEKGYKIVIGQKLSSKENKLLYGMRTIYYRVIKKYADVDMLEHFTGFGLYDRSVIEELKELKDSTPFLRGIVAELGHNRKVIPYEQQNRRAGKTSNNFYKLYDAAMLSFTSYTKIGLRMATFTGFIIAIVSFILSLVYLIMKLLYWERFVAGTAPILIGMLFLSSIVIVYIGFMGEYILSINERLMNRPLVIEEERLNF